LNIRADIDVQLSVECIDTGVTGCSYLESAAGRADEDGFGSLGDGVPFLVHLAVILHFSAQLRVL
jgi:hypothetical protein